MQSPQAQCALLGLFAVAFFLGAHTVAPIQQVVTPKLSRHVSQISSTSMSSIAAGTRSAVQIALPPTMGAGTRSIAASAPSSTIITDTSYLAPLPLMLACAAAFVAPLAVWLRLRQAVQPQTLQCFPLLAFTGETSEMQPTIPEGTLSRRSMGSLMTAAVVSPWLVASPSQAVLPLSACLYNILRVQEATQQEKRLINTGLYKDVQRANVKLAVRMMLENYRLGDVFVSATTYIPDTNKQVQAGQVGRSVIESLYTILEYFDASTVENLKIGEELYGDKRVLVLSGLDAVSQKIDEFLTYFPKSDIQEVRDLIAAENELNLKEYPEDMGKILNVDPK